MEIDDVDQVEEDLQIKLEIHIEMRIHGTNPRIVEHPIVAIALEIAEEVTVVVVVQVVMILEKAMIAIVTIAKALGRVAVANAKVVSYHCLQNKISLSYNHQMKKTKDN